MALTHIKIAKDLQELTLHGTKEFPVALYETVLRLDSMDFLPLHWHKEIQFVYVKSGRVEYRVGADVFILEEGEGLFVNASSLHEAKPFQIERATIFCINVNPVILGGHKDSIFATKYVLPYITSNRLPYVKLSDQLAQKIEFLAKLLQEQAVFYELKVWRELLVIWETILSQSMLTEEILDPAIIVQHDRAKEMLDYLHAHYQEKISLENLAAYVFLSRAECSRFFKKMVGITPFTYLLHYRLRKSMELLRDSEQSITTIATTTGFSTVSYYIEKFKKYTGYSPHVYRKQFFDKE
ncbi:AraC family transcriptional regulator [Lysinibacillus xylanilyticus]|uniref:AraC family transcriptional regulator n=1 Tax=Lysinibacillus xylanilyticus TaxID=582475 RepID=A0ABT4EWF6_9BACI|nr:AraC family transcriptional regulator [Lysinibacillus xylanilyticus]MCY9548524.1 AraC family transcriptional regulator [Lysinibacillus xylanilyticus]MED3801209.1 AraC family transcriptional regulator [Lysinibacillus xylanilyticus]